MPTTSSLAKNFSSEFLSQRQFGTYLIFKNRKGQLVKLCSHKKFNSPPFSFLDRAAKQIAFHLTGSGYAVVDLDRCFDSGRVKPWAAKFVQRMTLVTAHEISASGRGAHFFFKLTGEVTPDIQGIHYWKARDGAKGNDAGNAELYVNTKWVALTGNPIFNEPHPEVLVINASGVRELMQELASIRPNGKSSHPVPKATVEGLPLPELEKEFDIQVFLEWLDVPVWKVERGDGQTFYRLKYCPFDESQSGHDCMPAITMGETLGFVCHHPACAHLTITDVMRWARSNGRGKCPCKIWIDPSELWEKEQYERARAAGLLLPKIPGGEL